MSDDILYCLFCGSTDISVPKVGIAFGMAGDDYSFCRKCLESMTAFEFWARMFMHLGYKWPPKLKDGG
jgi:hypothetical protein